MGRDVTMKAHEAHKPLIVTPKYSLFESLQRSSQRYTFSLTRATKLSIRYFIDWRWMPCSVAMVVHIYIYVMVLQSGSSTGTAATSSEHFVPVVRCVTRMTVAASEQRWGQPTTTGRHEPERTSLPCSSLTARAPRSPLLRAG